MLHCSACCLARLRVLIPLSTSMRLPFTCMSVNHFLSFEHKGSGAQDLVTWPFTQTLELLTQGLAVHSMGPFQAKRGLPVGAAP